jgi:diguanylate cyclase (GGDEF)-like protein/PAS domain S-box-containing protein
MKHRQRRVTSGKQRFRSRQPVGKTARRRRTRKVSRPPGRPARTRLWARAALVGRAVLASSAVGVMRLDRGGRILECNRGLQRLAGSRAAAVRGRPWVDLLHPDDRDSSVAAFLDLVEGRRDHVQVERRWQRPDGALLWTMVRLIPIRAGARGGFCLALVEDVTEQKAAEAALREQLRLESIRDPLTGLFNRRYMEETLVRETRRAARSGHPVGIIMLDLDHFKSVNDRFGHDAGDRLLRAVGAMLSRSVRGEDIACRYGGEEFTLIMPEAPLGEAAARAEAVRRAIRDLRLEHRDETIGPVTVSAGVAVYPDHGATGLAALAAADAAMYVAKARGRDRVAVRRGVAIEEYAPGEGW